MEKRVGIRKEDKNIWERRVPLIPEHVRELKEKNGIEFFVEPFAERAFSNDEFAAAGAELNGDFSSCPLVIAVKEIPIKFLMPEKTYIFFSHTIKGQDYNMPLLQKLLDLKCTLIDYECITDEKGRRLVFFGRYAGLSGMIETLHGMGLRYKSLGYDTPFLNVKSAYEYKDLTHAKEEIAKIGEEIKEKGFPKELSPMVIGFTGYGNVSKGAQEVFDELPFKQITPDELLTLEDGNDKLIYKVEFKEEDIVEPVDESSQFELQDYYQHPEKYKSKFEQYLNKMDVLVNAVYWDERYPRLVTKDWVKRNADNLKLQIVSDISCDIDGSIEFTEKVTEPDVPAFVYNPDTDSITDGFDGKGVVDIAIDNLPTEIPVDASIGFSNALLPFIPGILDADLSNSFEEVNFPDAIKRAVIVYKGELTPNFKHLKKYL